MELKNNLAIDFDSFADTLSQILLEDSAVFRSIYPGSTAKILVDVLAGYAAMLMYRLQAAVSNTFLQTAFSEDSILAASEMLGVSITGNKGSSIDLTLSRNEMTQSNYPELNIPLYTNFEINGLNFYNREIYTFPSGYQRIHITLYQGEVHQKEFTTTGALNERFEFGSDFTTDLNFVRVFIDGKEWKTDRETILDYATNDQYDSVTTQVVLLKTDSSGISYIQFGNGLYGTIPMAGSIVTVYYASCDGLAGNFSGAGSITLKDNILYGDEILEVFSTNIGTASGGADKVTPSVLKYMSPRVFAANNRMVRRQDYVGLLMEYSGYKDVKVWGEFEESKQKGYADNSMMNIAYYSALPNNFSVKKITLGVGDGETSVFREDCNVSNTTEFPGSILVEYKYSWLDEDGKEIVYSENFRDYAGNGYLFSDRVTHTISSSSLPSKISTDSEHNSNLISNVIMDVDSTGTIVNSGDFFEAKRQPSTSAPVIIEFDMPEKVLNQETGELVDTIMAGIRLMASPFSSADDRAYPSKVLVIATREDEPEKQLWSYLQDGACEVIMTAQVNTVTMTVVSDGLNKQLKSQYTTIASNEVKATIVVDPNKVGTEVSTGEVIDCTITFENSPETQIQSKLIVGIISNKYYSFPELMHDEQWTVLSEVNSIVDPGSSNWGEWISFNTSSLKEEVITYKDGELIKKVLPNTFKHYRLIILGQHGSSEVQKLKINKIAFLAECNASKVNYETGDAVIKFEQAPIEDEVITATTIGEKISDYQFLIDYAYIKKMNHFTTEINYRDPKIKRIDIDLRVVYDTDADVASVRNNVEAAVSDLFQVQPGIIGRSMRLSEIYAAVMSVDGVKYCVINSPTSDIEADVNEILYLSNSTITYQSSARLI